MLVEDPAHSQPGPTVAAAPEPASEHASGLPSGPTSGRPTILVNGFGCYAGGMVRMHNAICVELAKVGEVRVASAPRGQVEAPGIETISAQDRSRARSFARDLRASLRFRRYDVRVDTAPAFRALSPARRHVVVICDLNFLDRSIHRLSWARSAYRRVLCHWTLRRAERVVCISEQTRREVVGLVPSAAGRAVTAPLPISPLPRATARAGRSAVAGGPIEILSFGHARNKGVEHLLRLLAVRPAARLTVIAPPEAWARLWADLADELGVADRVRRLSGLDDTALAAEYERADVFCMLSSYEGYGLPIGEALSLARPTVVGDHPVLAETGRGFALVVDPRDTAALSAALDQAREVDRAHWEQAAALFASWTWSDWADTAFGELTR